MFPRRAPELASSRQIAAASGSVLVGIDKKAAAATASGGGGAPSRPWRRRISYGVRRQPSPPHGLSERLAEREVDLPDGGALRAG